MTDILAILRPAQLTMPAASRLPVLARPRRRRIARTRPHRQGRCGCASPRASGKIPAATPQIEGASRNRKHQSPPMRRISSKPPAASSSAGSVAVPSPEIQAVLAERDAVCFRAEKPQTRARPKAPRRNPHAAPQGRAWPASSSPPLASAPPGPRRGHRHARPRKPTTPRNTTRPSNSGSAPEATTNSTPPGSTTSATAGTASAPPRNAALYYRRALLRQPGHPEALQNLRFLERKFGLAFTIKRPDYQVRPRPPARSASGAGLVWAGAWLLRRSACSASPPPVRDRESAWSPQSPSSQPRSPPASAASAGATTPMTPASHHPPARLSSSPTMPWSSAMPAAVPRK